MSKLLVHGLVFSLSLAVFTVVVNYIRKGEPRLLQAIVTGLVVGFTVAVFTHWQKKKNAKAEIGDKE